MRIKITLASCSKGAIDFNYQHQIQGLIYKGFLAKSNPEYASSLHKHGYVYERDKRFKLFVFSGILFHKPIRPAHGFTFNGTLSDPFTFSFQIASPINEFIRYFIDGIFKEGQEIKLGRQKLNVHRVETIPDPLENIGSNRLNGLNGLNLRPLESPIFVKKPMPEGERDKYLFPGDEGYEKLLNQNLIHKYETIHGKPYKGEVLNFDFNQLEQLKRFKQLEPKLFKSFKVFKNGKITGEIKGTLQPFTVTGSEELIRIGLDCGFGQNNSMGCGYVETVQAA